MTKSFPLVIERNLFERLLKNYVNVCHSNRYRLVLRPRFLGGGWSDICAPHVDCFTRNRAVSYTVAVLPARKTFFGGYSSIPAKTSSAGPPRRNGGRQRLSGDRVQISRTFLE